MKKYMHRVFKTTIRNPTNLENCGWWIVFPHDGQRGGAGRSWCQSTPRLWKCCIWGGMSSWPGLEQGLGRMEVVRDCKCECPLWPLFASDSWVQGQDGSLPLVLVELVQSCSMVRGRLLWKAAGGDEKLKLQWLKWLKLWRFLEMGSVKYTCLN